MAIYPLCACPQICPQIDWVLYPLTCMVVVAIGARGRFSCDEWRPGANPDRPFILPKYRSFYPPKVKVALIESVSGFVLSNSPEHFYAFVQGHRLES